MVKQTANKMILFILVVFFSILCCPTGVLIADDGASGGTGAEISKLKIFMNQSVTELQSYNIDGYNYIRLRDLASAFTDTDKKFDTDYDSLRNEITIIFGKPAGSVNYNLSESPSTPVACEVFLSAHGKIKKMNAYNIDGNNYFWLEDLSLLLDYSVTYDSTGNEAYISSLDMSATWISADKNDGGYFFNGQSEQEVIDVLSAFNLPYTLTTYTGSNVTGESYTKKIYNIGAGDLKIGIIAEKVVNIYTDKFSTKEGLAIGDPIDKVTEVYGIPELTNGSDFLYNIDGGYLVIYSNHKFSAYPSNEPLKVESFYYDFGDNIYYFAGIKEIYFDSKSQYLEETPLSVDNPAPAKLWSTFDKHDGGVFYFGQSESEVADMLKQYDVKLLPQSDQRKYDIYGAEIINDNEVTFVAADYSLTINLTNDKVVAIHQSIYSSTKEGLKTGDPIEMTEQIYGKPVATDFTNAQGFLYKIGDNYLEIRGNNQTGIFIPYYPIVVSNFHFISPGDSILEGFYPKIAHPELFMREDAQQWVKDNFDTAVDIWALFNLGTNNESKDGKQYVYDGDKIFAPYESEQFKNIEDIKSYTESVYTQEYAEQFFYKPYFGDSQEQSLPLYKEYDGKLFVNMQNGGKGFMGYDLITDTLTIRSQTEDEVVLWMDSRYGGEEAGQHVIKLKKANGMWLMDCSIFGD